MEPQELNNQNMSNSPSQSPTSAISSTLSASTVSSSKPPKSKALIATSIICGILAVAGITFGIYEFLESNQKSQQISDLKTNIEYKDTKVTELETKISNLDAEKEDVKTIELETTISSPEPKTEKKDGTITIILGDKISETANVFKIGDCTADGSTATPESHFYIKCPITTTEGEALISWHNNDNVLRLTLLNN